MYRDLPRRRGRLDAARATCAVAGEACAGCLPLMSTRLCLPPHVTPIVSRPLVRRARAKHRARARGSGGAAGRRAQGGEAGRRGGGAARRGYGAMRLTGGARRRSLSSHSERMTSWLCVMKMTEVWSTSGSGNQRVWSSNRLTSSPVPCAVAPHARESKGAPGPSRTGGRAQGGAAHRGSSTR